MYYIEGPYKPLKRQSTLKAIISAEAHELLTWAIVGTITACCVYTLAWAASAIGAPLL